MHQAKTTKRNKTSQMFFLVFFISLAIFILVSPAQSAGSANLDLEEELNQLETILNNSPGYSAFQKTMILNSASELLESGVSFDDTKFRAGTKSIKMVFNGDETHDINLNKLSFDNNVKILFWINATNDAPLTITATGINDGNKVFSMSKVYYPKIDQWQKITFTTNTSYVNDLKISVNAEDLTLWIDDIEINSYK